MLQDEREGAGGRVILGQLMVVEIIELGSVLVPDIGFVSGRPPDDAGFAAALDDELQRISVFLSLT